MSRNIAQFRQQKLAQMDLSTSKFFKTFGYGWTDNVVGPVGPSEVMERIQQEIVNDPTLTIDDISTEFDVILPRKEHDDAKIEIVDVVTEGMTYMPTKQDMQRLYERFGYSHPYKITSSRDVDILLDSPFEESDFGLGAISVMAMRVLEKPLVEEEMPVIEELDYYPEKVYLSVGEQYIRSCSPFFFHYEGHSMCFDDYIVEDNYYLSTIAKQFNVDLYLLITYRSVGRSLLDTFTLLRIELDESSFQSVIDRDKRLCDEGIVHLASKIGIEVKALVSGIYVRAALCSTRRSYTQNHPFWLLLGGSAYSGPKTYCAIELEQFFFLHRVLETGYLAMDVSDGITDWICEGYIMRHCGFSLVPGGIAITGVSYPAIFGRFPNFVKIRVVSSTANWGRMMDYVVTVSAGGHDVLQPLYNEFFREYKELGFNPRMSPAICWGTLHDPYFQEFIYNKWIRTTSVHTLVTHKFTSKNLPQVCGYDFGNYDVVWFLSVLFGGPLPHDCVRMIFGYLPSSINLVTTSYMAARGFAPRGPKYLRDLGHLLGEGVYPEIESDTVLPSYPEGDGRQFSVSLGICCDMKYRGEIWNRKTNTGRFYKQPATECARDCLCWKCREIPDPYSNPWVVDV